MTKYDAGGNKLYTKQLGVAGKSTSPDSISVNAQGDIYIAGNTNGSLDGNILAGIYDLFFTKYDTVGNKLYTKQFGAVGATSYANSNVTDANGNIFMTGSTDGGIDGNALVGIRDMFLMKFDSAGNKK